MKLTKPQAAALRRIAAGDTKSRDINGHVLESLERRGLVAVDYSTRISGHFAVTLTGGRGRGRREVRACVIEPVVARCSICGTQYTARAWYWPEPADPPSPDRRSCAVPGCGSPLVRGNVARGCGCVAANDAKPR